MTTFISAHQVRAPEELAGDVMAALDFIGGEIAVATVYGLAGVEIIATPEVLPTLATAAAALDSADLPEQFHLVEG
ncbi:hypothetical protein QP028_06750 [Corynebacterium suedekumii]|uniref:Uncharacterized protein n=1 Tax=Corynebacterium suedekumii TaxID=3049801 RepID=A0ABY8VPS0_9CORY|nr:hypothetical protein [Corynebacterium suedekumii]WIM71077.1 hypothetical protein QP029_04530 [Corynebacterium suedekumii]WIM73233.1 hypothetical protein QP028_06750 [Corynebacterium suedekumii]